MARASVSSVRRISMAALDAAASSSSERQSASASAASWALRSLVSSSCFKDRPSGKSTSGAAESFLAISSTVVSFGGGNQAGGSMSASRASAAASTGVVCGVGGTTIGGSEACALANSRCSSRAVLTRMRSALALNGLRRMSVAPAQKASMDRSSRMDFEPKTITGMSRWASFRRCRISKQICKAPTFASMRSMRTSFGRSSAVSKYANASAPVLHWCTRAQEARFWATTCWLMVSRSTERMRGLSPDSSCSRSFWMRTASRRSVSSSSCCSSRGSWAVSGAPPRSASPCSLVRPLEASSSSVGMRWDLSQATASLSHLIRTVKVVPCPRTDLALISPEWSCAMPCATERPKPTPWKFRVSLTSSCSKGSKIRFRAPGAMPVPLSETLSSTQPAAASCVASMETQPLAVNLQAFVVRLYSICVSLPESP
mmetsp:Transcript_30537/g.85162  ORF Transcript_30537/g.85162 Transcript_30537/m.85162 type:complete len:429 (+) Transcript_30537:770-2056(+)